MASYKCVFLFYVVCFILKVNALRTCDQNIISNILRMNNCPTGVLSKLNKLSPFTYTVNPKGSVPDYIRCTNGQIGAPKNGRSDALVTAYYKDATKAPAKIKYFQQDVGCGHIKEWDDKNIEYQIYMLKDDLVFCYYRCTTFETEGQDFAACAAPVSQTNDPKVKTSIKECKAKLKAVGVTGELVDLVTCKT